MLLALNPVEDPPPVAGGTFEPENACNMANDWWHLRQEELLSVAEKGCPIYVYNEETLNETFFDLLSIDPLDLIFYPVHANPHPRILKKALEMDVGFKCISVDEITRVLKNFPRLSPRRILFVPDHAHGKNFDRAFNYGAHVAVNDSMHSKGGRVSFKTGNSSSVWI